MEISIINTGTEPIVEIKSDQFIFDQVDEAIQLMMDCKYLHQAYKAIFYQENIHPDFFELKTKLAGEILQKFTQYGFDIAIVGDFTKYKSKSLDDFIFESNKGRRINFTSNREEAIQRLSVN